MKKSWAATSHLKEWVLPKCPMIKSVTENKKNQNELVQTLWNCIKYPM